MRAQSGDLIEGRYRLDAGLGDGAFGEVWRAVDTRIDRVVAVKLLKSEHADAPQVVARFHGEAVALARLSHPNIVALYDRGVWNQREYLVTEYVEGAPLTRWLARFAAQGRWPPFDEVRGLFDQVCAGVEAAHAVRAPGAIVHRDLKPDNVIVRELANGERLAKVLDFGIAQLGERGHTRTGAMMGTLAYMAPEQATGQSSAIGPWTDVFSLGVLLTEMLTLRASPRAEEPWWALSLREGHHVPALLAALRAEVPPGVWQVVATALRSDGGARFPHAGALREALQRAWSSAVPAAPRPAVARTEFMEGFAIPNHGVPSGAPAPMGPSNYGVPGGGAPSNYGMPGAPPAPWGAGYAPAPAAVLGAAPVHPYPGPVRPAPRRTPVGAIVGAVALVLVALVGLVAVSGVFSDQKPSGNAAAADAAVDAALGTPLVARRLADAERIPVGDSPVRGNPEALVTIVEFSDFQCPFCGRVEETLRQILQQYGNDVRVVWKSNPLPFHERAMPAALAAREVFRQGGNDKFWAYHGLLFQNQQNLDNATLERLAQQVGGINLDRFRAALSESTHRDRTQQDQQLAQRLEAGGTPTFFINGSKLVGAQPLARFTALIDRVLARARTVVPRERVYAEMVAHPLPGDEPSPDGQRRQEDPNAVYNVPVGNSPVLGSPDALVTMVVFSDFQCPFCQRVEGTLRELRSRYGNDLRVVWKNEPLPFHDRARPAAYAAMEALAQGGNASFWRMHDALFENQASLGDRALERYAQQLGLDLASFRAALRDRRHEAAIAADHALAQRVEANGTPHFFINGRRLVGAQPLRAFESAIDDARQRAETLIRTNPGTTRWNVYERLIERGATGTVYLPGAGDAPAPTADNPGRDENRVYQVRDNPGAPGLGRLDAPVVIQHFSDFQCPFCARVLPTIDQIMQRYRDQVRLVWRDYPLPFHNNAMPAAEAAREVLAQRGADAFWRYHHLLFQNSASLERATLERLAGEIGGVNMDRFRAALDNHTHQAAVREDMAAADATGAQIGTPAFFINGKFVAGAHPFAEFERRIDAALAERARGR